MTAGQAETCNGCFCVPQDGQNCPTNTYQTEFSDELLENLRSIPLENPMDLDCNFYKDESCTTSPPVAESGGVCVIEYTYASDDSNDETAANPMVSNANIDENNSTACPISYRLKTVASRREAHQNFQILTHEGPCGTCSTLQDLAVYMEKPNLSSVGIRCGFRALTNFTDGVQCYIENGFSEPCGKTWVYNSLTTNELCEDLCLNHAFGQLPNNFPDTCELAECIECDEINSGPLFQKFAGRTRRRSGILSAIVRKCSENIDPIVHYDPCTTDIPLLLTMPPTVSPAPSTSAPSQIIDANSDIVPTTSPTAAMPFSAVSKFRSWQAVQFGIWIGSAFLLFSL